MVKNVKFFSQVDLESGIASLAVFLFGEGEVKTSFLGEERVVHLKEEGVREDYYILEIKLWEGMAPYLYPYFVDDKEYRIGLRSLGLDEKRGFFLNGRRYPLDGNNPLLQMTCLFWIPVMKRALWFPSSFPLVMSLQRRRYVSSLPTLLYSSGDIE